MSVTLRLANVSDAGQLFLLNEAFNGEGSNTPEGIAASLEANAQERVAVAETDGHLIGFLCAQPLWSMCYGVRYVELTELYVDPAHRRRGVGGALIGFMEDSYRREGIEHFQLFTGGDNLNAQSLYRMCGYIDTEEMMFRKKP